MIDTHQHNWLLNRTLTYHWITPGTVLYRDFPTDEIKAQMDAAGVAACVLVEADNSFAEIGWMLEQAQQYPHIRGVVGWGDLRDAATPGELARYTDNPLLKGVRVYWEEPEDDHGAMDDGLRFLADHGLSCDLVVKPQSYRQITETIAKHPGVQFVLDHLAGVPIVPGGASAWAKAIQPLADLPNAALKLSGYMTSAKPTTVENIQPYFAVALEQFRENRLLYGSDYPVCTVLGQTYPDSVALLRGLVAPLDAAQQEAILTRTAERVYRL